jgi:hypothetical protein
MPMPQFRIRAVKPSAARRVSDSKNLGWNPPDMEDSANDNTLEPQLQRILRSLRSRAPAPDEGPSPDEDLRLVKAFQRNRNPNQRAALIALAENMIKKN